MKKQETCLVSLNNNLACEPPASLSVEKDTSKGFAIVQQRQQLIPLTVLFDAEGYSAGQTIYVRGESIKQQWMAQTLSLEDGTKFILVPQSAVVLAEFPSYMVVGE